MDRTFILFNILNRFSYSATNIFYQNVTFELFLFDLRHLYTFSEFQMIYLRFSIYNRGMILFIDIVLLKYCSCSSTLHFVPTLVKNMIFLCNANGKTYTFRAPCCICRPLYIIDNFWPYGRSLQSAKLYVENRFFFLFVPIHMSKYWLTFHCWKRTEVVCTISSSISVFTFIYINETWNGWRQRFHYKFWGVK